MSRRILFYLPLFLPLLLASCYFTGTGNLNVADTLNGLRVKRDSSTNEIINVKKVYRLKNGEVIDKYNGRYGTWYMIRRGDTLYGLSRRLGTGVSTLARVNGLSSVSQLQYKAFLFLPMSEAYLNRNAEVIEVELRKGQYIWPLISRITSGFGLRRWGWRKKFHAGVDLAAPVGTKILSAADGEVVSASRSGAYGYMIKIAHQDYFHTLYAHLEKILVRKGDSVQQGQVIGLVGKTGRSTGYHLHFEMRIRDYPVNPEDYLPSLSDGLSDIYDRNMIKSVQ